MAFGQMAGQGIGQFPQGFADYLQQYKQGFNNQFGMNPGDVARPRMLNYLQNQVQPGQGMMQFGRQPQGQPIRQVSGQGFMPGSNQMMNNPMMRLMLQQYIQSIMGQQGGMGGMPQFGSLA